jgi:hypothetical protein
MVTLEEYRIEKEWKTSRSLAPAGLASRPCCPAVSVAQFSTAITKTIKIARFLDISSLCFLN